MSAACWRILLAAASLLLVAPSPSVAQFETPNRSFHNGTGFLLEGKHQTVACESCHVNGQFRATPATCYACHWQRRRDDPYQTSLGTQCEQCHRPVSWTAVRWDHGGQAGVPLNAEHRLLDCRSCHKAATFSVATVNCVSCHQREFSSTTSPNHAAAGFPVTCDACHRAGDSTWRNGGGAGFNHQSVFPLVGNHRTQACATCHVSNTYRGTPRDCVGCHQDNYSRTTRPSHVAANFPTTCETCHRPTDSSWTAGTGFNHQSVFPLVGNHRTQACATCHVNNTYRGTPRECVGCHRNDYNRTRDPNHASVGFSTTCSSCHRPTDGSWDQGSFSHTWFPLTGPHNRACAQCHTTPNTYALFSCTTCHARGETDGHHREIRGYRYESTACYSCHPNGRH
jgi:hypothetical protein